MLDGVTSRPAIRPAHARDAGAIGAIYDEAIASVLTFIRRSWGQEADPVTVATVAESRAATAKRDEPWSDNDLDALVRALSAPPPAN